MAGVRTYRGFREELAYCASDGIHVWLFWRRSDDRLTVQVSDATTKVFEVDAPRSEALDVFYHRFAHLALPDAA